MRTVGVFEQDVEGRIEVAAIGLQRAPVFTGPRGLGCTEWRANGECRIE
jgi:hypothetical protein